MSEFAFFILLAIGTMLALSGLLLAQFQAFQVSLVWGLLFWFVPFANLVFVIRFWSQLKQVRWATYSFLSGVTLMVVLSALIPPNGDLIPK